ncbi:DUF72 domain-containing protein [Spirulina sp. 06S082]|uniref:DUF72 domain-containing protein n=1 Tax=Spirulina sp. 06S082 TaxID=3110248 RepID=UPI002B1F2015|nr:DUF72 domain-containing protein [Spirulina sp. 06S082]MEA5469782.1 DUF72 domain-containing protein [Spirulina sp. 06S082]
MNFYLGCAVWSYKGWVGDFYPDKTPQGDFLRLYSDRFTSVEGNTTFYAVPDRNTVARWKAQTPSGFHFCPKMPKIITHNDLLIPNQAEAIAFLERMGKLGDRLGVTFIQLPPNYSPEAFDDLKSFLSQLPYKEYKLALEVRHLDWFQAPHGDRLNQLLQNLNIGRVLLDTRPVYHSSNDPQLHSRTRKPDLPLQPIVTSDLSLIRFISHPQSQFNQIFLQEWTQQIDLWLQDGKTIYFFVHCPQEEHSPQTARDFQALLEAKGTIVPDLPWNHLKMPPKQLSLF